MTEENDKVGGIKNYLQKENVEKEDLLRLLACLQSELEAREEVINILRLERLRAVDFRAKYGFGDIEKAESDVGKDPFHALQRDSLVLPDNSSHAEADLKPLYDTQLVQLENLITSQRRAQDTMREQLLIMERKYLKVCKELEDERNKHERDAAQGDDVLVMLEKERERLKSEVEYERGLNRKLERDLRRVLLAFKEQTLLLNSQKIAAVSIIKERHRFSLDRKASDHKREQPSVSRDAETSSVTNLEASSSSLMKDQASGHYEYQPMNESFADDGCFLSRECVRLRQLLADEISARKLLKDQFDRLQKEHQLLLKSSNKKNSCLDPSHSGSPTALIDPPRNDRSSSSNPAISSSIGPAQRPKPNPPMRRSSEISNTCSSASQTNMNFTGCSSPIYESNTSELAVHIESGGLSNIPSNPDSSSISPNVPLCVNVSLQSISTSPVTRSLSRSSTPSPPPPPPPIQLHYPYPAMQSHVHHGQSHNLSINSPFVPNINRPTSGSVAHAVAAKSRPTLTSHGSHLVNSPCQIPFAPPSPTNQTSRMSFTPSTRGSVTRRSTTVTAHPLQTDTTTNASNYSTPFVSSQSKVSPVGQQQYPSRSTTQHILSPTGGHHFPAYPAVRQHITSGLPATGLTNLRGGRAPVPPASSALSSSGGSLGSGHVCINGK